jgi:hypothetical protein
VGVQLVEPDTVDVIVGLRRAGWSLRRICWLLEREGRPAPRGGQVWRHSTVRKILARELGEASAAD